MSEIAWVDAGAQELFRSHGFKNLEEFCNNFGKTVSQARTRRLARLRLADRTFYVKVQDLRGVRLPVRKWPSYALRGSPLIREARSLVTLRQHGFTTAPLVATGVSKRLVFPRIALLVTEELEGYVDLVRWLEAGRDARTACTTLDAADALVRAAHAKGIVLLGAKYRNILVPEAGAITPSEFALIDQPDLRASRSERLRRKDRRLMQFDRARYGGSA